GRTKKSGGPKPAANSCLKGFLLRSEPQGDAAEDEAASLVVAAQGVGVPAEAGVTGEGRLLVKHVVHAQGHQGLADADAAIQVQVAVGRNATLDPDDVGQRGAVHVLVVHAVDVAPAH